MNAHPQAEVVQDHALWLAGMLCGEGARAAARKQRAAQAGVIEAAVAAMNAYPQSEGVQYGAIVALNYVCAGRGVRAAAWQQRASDAGARAAVERAVAAFPYQQVQGPAAELIALLAWL
jgi:hypothetical protein